MPDSKQEKCACGLRARDKCQKENPAYGKMCLDGLYDKPVESLHRNEL